MQMSASGLAQRYSQKSDEELLALHGAGTLTYEAYETLESELLQRNLSIPARRAPDETMCAAEQTYQRQTLKSHWRGEARLASAYWLVGVVGSWVVGGLVVAVSSFAPQLYLLALAALVAFEVFASVSIWRCAKNTSWVGWGYIARTVVVLTAGYMLLALVLLGLAFTAA